MSNTLIKQRQIINNDPWLLLTEEDPIPSHGDLIVPYSRWQAEREGLLEHNGRLGIVIGNGVSVDSIKNDLAHFELIAIEFPEFKDGRGYSYAKLLRERYGFSKEIRAIGNVLRDQLAYMERCGINAFALESGKDAANAMLAFNEFSMSYQPPLAS